MPAPLWGRTRWAEAGVALGLGLLLHMLMPPPMPASSCGRARLTETGVAS